MLNRFCWLSLLLAAWFGISGSAHAHFLWIVAQPDDKSPSAKVYFSETAAPDDPQLLDRVLKAEVWAMTGRRGNEPQPLTLEKRGDALVADLGPEARQSPLALRHTFGVVTRGGESFLLKYCAKTYPFALPGTWRSINDADLLPLELVPALSRTGIELKALWLGKPQAGVAVTIEGPGLEGKLEGTSDETGLFHCRLPESGLYSIRAKHIETMEGEHEGTVYKSVRHYSTLALPFLSPLLKSADHDWPALPKGITSFGGAVSGDWLYVYGGHYGKAHEYSRDEQSGDFYRLGLRAPHQWESLPGGPKLTGLAMVAHRGKLYRVGGFTAKNAASEEESLWSQADFARFDPETKQWESLAPLPESRSSHDAAILGNTLYIAGGWEMQDGQKKWHDTAWAIDLSAGSVEWKPLPQPPFRQRALALAVWQDKLYCLGGMLQQGGPTTAVVVFNPATNEWSQGPALVGSGMDGFGCSAFACGGRLYATTMSGSVQQLSPAGDRWVFVGQLQHPRFFHRLLPWQDDRLIVVGGASMSAGKILSLELLLASTVRDAAR